MIHLVKFATDQPKCQERNTCDVKTQYFASRFCKKNKKLKNSENFAIKLLKFRLRKKMEVVMLKKINWIVILLFISGSFLFVVAQNNFENHPGENGLEHGRREEGHRDVKITPKLEKRISQALKTHFPNFHGKAVKLKKEHPRIYKKLLRKLRRHIRRSREPKEEKKELISIIFEESEIDILIYKYRTTEDKNDKAKVKAVIRKKMSIGFDKRENIQKKVIEKIEKNIQKKKKKLQERIRDKEEIIDKHLEELLN